MSRASVGGISNPPHMAVSPSSSAMTTPSYLPFPPFLAQPHHCLLSPAYFFLYLLEIETFQSQSSKFSVSLLWNLNRVFMYSTPSLIMISTS